MRIDIKNHDLSKAEEIAIIEKLHTFFKGSDTYLASLFTDDFLGWVSQQIKDDIMPDLYDQGIGGNLPLRKEIEDLKRAIEYWKKESEGLATNVKIKSDLAEKNDKRIGELFEDKACLEEIIDGKANVIDELRLEVMTLKSKFYDLISKDN